jgi:hypothetical protein
MKAGTKQPDLRPAIAQEAIINPFFSLQTISNPKYA